MHTLHPTPARPTTEEWSRFLSVVAEYRRAEPWEVLDEKYPLIAVENPLGGETAYCIPSPHIRRGAALTIYLGRDGLEYYRNPFGSTKTRARPQDDDSASDREKSTWNTFEGYSLIFVDEKIFPDARYHLIPLSPNDQHSGRLRYIEVRRHTGEEDPCEPDSLQLDFLGDILRNLIETTEQVQQEGERFLERAGPGEIWTLTPEIDPVTFAIDWKGAWKRPEIPLLPDPIEPSDEGIPIPGILSPSETDPHPATPQELSLWREILPELERSDDMFLLFVTPEAIRVSRKNAPPIRRRVLGILSVVDGAFVASVALDDPQENPVEVRRGILEVLQAREEIPSVVNVGDRRLHAMLSPLSRTFGFVLLYREMPTEIATEITSFIEFQITRVTDGHAEDGEFGIMMKGEEPQGIPNRPPSDALSDVMLPLEHFCSENFTATLYQEALDLTAWLDYSDDPSPLERGRPEVWACGIAWFIASEHNLWHKPQNERLTTDALCEWFGVKKRTADRRREKIREIVGGK